MRRRALASLALAGLVVGVLLPTACRSPFSRALNPRPLTPLERGEYRGPAPQITGEVGPASDVVQRMARVFYVRIINRRFNSLSTYHDPALRELFVTSEAFADYFAALADAFVEARFEALRPEWVSLEQLDVVERNAVLVTVRFRGQNSRPLRWWSVDLVRVDRWEQVDGLWRIIPGKL
jgi:hypothetical protein